MKALSLAVALVIVVSFGPAAAQNLDAELQRAVQKEMVSGDLKAAIEEYRRIVARAGDNRVVKARALLRMADAHRKLGDAESRKLYQQVVAEFGDQKDAVAEARARLAAAPPATVPADGQSARQLWSAPDADAMGGPTADGGLLTYTNWMTGDLAIRDLAKGTSRHLTNTGGWEASGDFAEFSVPSPDGRDVIYAWFANGRRAYELRVIATSDGARPRTLIGGDDLHWVMPAAWTPDGRHAVIYLDQKGAHRQLGLVTIATGAFRPLVTVPQSPRRLSLSADGRFLAYDTSSSGNDLARDLYVTAIDTPEPVRVDASPSNDEAPMWMPDGSHLVFISNRSGSNALWVMPMSNGKPAGAARVLKQDVGNMFLLGMTRAGSLIYHSSGDRFNNRLVSIDRDFRPTAESQPLTEAFVNANSGASWSPDGERIAYYTFQGYDPKGVTLVIRQVKSGEERHMPLGLHVGRGSGTPIRWFPDGRAVFVVSRDPSEDGQRYHRIDLATGAQQVLHRTRWRGPSMTGAVLSHDGGAIIYIDRGDAPGTQQVRRFDLASRQDVLLKDVYAMSLAVSPDGKELAMIIAPHGDKRDAAVAIMPVGGGEMRTVYSAPWWDGSRQNTLTWTPDGRWIVFARREGTDETFFWRVPAAGGPAQKTTIGARGALKGPQISRDGTRLLYSLRDISDNAVWLLENFLPRPAAGSSRAAAAGGRR